MGNQFVVVQWGHSMGNQFVVVQSIFVVVVSARCSVESSNREAAYQDAHPVVLSPACHLSMLRPYEEIVL